MNSTTSAQPKSPSFTGMVWQEGRLNSWSFNIEGGNIREDVGPSPRKAAYIIPLFSDPHIHGGWGLSFQAGEFEPLERRLRAAGIGFAIPTIQNSPLQTLQDLAAAFSDYKKRQKDSIFPFLRVEGPFISDVKKGIQRPEFIQEASPDKVAAFLSIDAIRVFTFAPEIAGSDSLVKQALERDKIPSFGHSQAGYEDFAKAYSQGVRHFTHYPNAMSGLHHRNIGLVGAGLLHDDLELEVIADGIHNTYDFIRLLWKCRGSRFALVSDMIPPAYAEAVDFDGRRLSVEGRRYTDDHGTLAGGGTSVPEQARLLVARGFPIEDIIRMACVNSRTAYGLPEPSLQPGAEASFVLTDTDLQVQAVYHRGCLIKGGQLDG